MIAKRKETFPTDAGEIQRDTVADERADLNRFHGLRFEGRKSSFRAKRRMDMCWVPALRVHRLVMRPEGKKVVVFDPEEVSFVKYMLGEAGLDPAGYRLAPLIRRIPACLRALRVERLAAALGVVRDEPARLPVALNALLIGTTAFFRDSAVFQALERGVIPELVGRVHAPRVKSVACSGGEELYSVAMMFAEHRAFDHAQLVGCDCRPAAVQIARKGEYPVASTHGMPSRYATRYLVHDRTKVRIHRALAGRLEWECEDALAGGDSRMWDMILCRNLAIYLEPAVTQHLWERLAASLNPGGVLVVGRAEKPRVKGLLAIGPCIYQKNFVPH